MPDPVALADAGRVVANPERFKARLAIGEDAFAARRARKWLWRAWDTAGAAGTGAAAAKSTLVATTLFAPAVSANPLVWLGVMAPAAVTPIGWVIASALAAGGAWYGVSRWMNAGPDAYVDVIPKFLNTPVDVLGMRLLDLHAALAFQVAAADGTIDPAERAAIREHFEQDWGYDPAYLDAALPVIERDCGDADLARVADALVQFQRSSRDCSAVEMERNLATFLREVAGADDVDAPEERAVLAVIDQTLAGARALSLKRAASDLADWSSTVGEAVREAAASAGTVVRDGAVSAGTAVARGGEASGRTLARWWSGKE